MKYLISRAVQKTTNYAKNIRTKFRIILYLLRGRIPWSKGYVEYKEKQIHSTLTNATLIASAVKDSLRSALGKGIDERIIEYLWLAGNIPSGPAKILDAGSTFNFAYILDQTFLLNKELTILTYHPEMPNFNHRRISYIYSDIRHTPLRNAYFDVVVSQSTIEHIDMDNSIYGYDMPHESREQKSYEYLKAITELVRVLKRRGMLLLTFPFGKFEHHGFFQQFDSEMLGRIKKMLKNQGKMQAQFFRYQPEGWISCSEQDCKDIGSYNPHTGRGKGNDGAAHCRSICCIYFIKK